MLGRPQPHKHWPQIRYAPHDNGPEASRAAVRPQEHVVPHSDAAPVHGSRQHRTHARHPEGVVDVELRGAGLLRAAPGAGVGQGPEEVPEEFEVVPWVVRLVCWLVCDGGEAGAATQCGVMRICMHMMC